MSDFLDLYKNRLINSIEKEKQVMMLQICNNTMKDYPDYKYWCGKINAMEIAIKIINHEYKTFLKGDFNLDDSN